MLLSQALTKALAREVPLRLLVGEAAPLGLMRALAVAFVGLGEAWRGVVEMRGAACGGNASAAAAARRRCAAAERRAARLAGTAAGQALGEGVGGPSVMRCVTECVALATGHGEGAGLRLKEAEREGEAVKDCVTLRPPPPAAGTRGESARIAAASQRRDARPCYCAWRRGITP